MVTIASSVSGEMSFRKSSGRDDHHVRTRRKLSLSRCFYFVSGLLLVLHSPESSVAYYVGPEVGKAPGETRVAKTRGFGFGFPNNATSLAEAAYVPYVYSVGNNVVTFLRSIIPALQPKVDFFAEQIQDSIDIANGKLMQTLENSNNGIVAVENFFTGLMRAVVLGKGPEDEERRRRLAMALIKSGMLNSISSASTTTSSTSTTRRPTMTMTTGGTLVVKKRSTRVTTSTEASITTTAGATTTSATTQISRDGSPTPKSSSPKARDNVFNKMQVINIVRNML